jgi:diguanylate cyclase (GGDEF)-like protein
LEQRSRETSAILEINGELQTVRSTTEAFSTATNGIDKLFPGWCGFIGQLRALDRMIEIQTTWGGFQPPRPEFHAWECLAMISGAPFQGMVPDPEGACPHLAGNFPTHQYLCLPITANQQVLGLFHMQLSPALQEKPNLTSPTLTDSRLSLVKNLTDQLGQVLLDFQSANTNSRDMFAGYKIYIHDRNSLVERLQRELQKAFLINASVALLVFHVDMAVADGDFQINPDHETVLKSIDKQLIANIRKEDSAGRISSNQYGVILRHTGADQAMYVAKRISTIISRIRLPQSNEKIPAPAVGVVVFSGQSEPLDNPLAMAERVLEKARLDGYGSIQLKLC